MYERIFNETSDQDLNISMESNQEAVGREQSTSSNDLSFYAKMEKSVLKSLKQDESGERTKNLPLYEELKRFFVYTWPKDG